MTEAPSEGRRDEAGISPAMPDPVPAAEHPSAEIPAPARPNGGHRHPAAWLAGLLLLVIAGIAFSPFWAPEVAPLLPWGGTSAAAIGDYPALAARLSEIEKRPAPPSSDVGAIKSAASALGQRVDRLEAERNADGQTAAAVAATRTAVQQIEQRLGAINSRAAAGASSLAAEIGKLQQEVTRLGGISIELADRLAALERQAREQTGADRAAPALLLALLQMREAVEAARPFPTEYDAFLALAHGDPDMAAAAQPLAEAARSGVPGRAVLQARLADLAGRIGTAPEPAAGDDWWAQALARLRGLVTIRRISGSGATGPEAAVGAAETALARGDLPAAIDALGALTGADAEAAEPWLRMARERRTVEAALSRLQELLVARLGQAPAAAPGNPPPAAPTKPGSPS